VLFGAAVSGRPAAYPAVDRTVGVFINTLPFRVRLDVALCVDRWLHGLQQQQLEMLEHETTPLSEISAWAGCSRRRPLFESILVCQNALEGFEGRGMGPVRIGAVRSTGHPHYPLMFRITPGASMLLEIVFDSARIDRASAELMLEQACTALRLLPRTGQTTVGDLMRMLADARADLDVTRRDALTARLGQTRRAPVARLDQLSGDVQS
jgi:non-ribosomal peptide synthetase component F